MKISNLLVSAVFAVSGLLGVAPSAFADRPWDDGYYQNERPWDDGYVQDERPWDDGYIQDDRPWDDGYVQDKDVFGF